MNIVSKVINRLELEKCKIEQYRVGKKIRCNIGRGIRKVGNVLSQSESILLSR